MIVYLNFNRKINYIYFILFNRGFTEACLLLRTVSQVSDVDPCQCPFKKAEIMQKKTHGLNYVVIVINFCCALTPACYIIRILLIKSCDINIHVCKNKYEKLIFSRQSALK